MAFTPSNLLSNLLGKLASLGHITSGLTTIANTMAGGEKPAAGGGFFERIARMVPAVLTKDDEIKYELLLQKFDEVKKIGVHDVESPRKILVQFTQWHFKKRCVGERAFSLWYENSFRKFIVDLDGDGKDERGHKFLIWMVRTILDEGHSNIEVGFARLVEQLDHVPHNPEDAARYIARAQELMDQAIENTIRGYREARVGIRRHRKDVEARVRDIKNEPKSFLDWLIK
jgi:hypothetical protein